MESDLEDEGPPETVDSDEEEERGSTTPPIRRWNRVEKTQCRRSRKTWRPEVGTTPSRDLADGLRGELEQRTIPGEDPSESTRSTTTGALTVITATSINGLEKTAEEWEEIEFMVDSGAGVTVVGPENVRPVEASEPDHSI